MAEKLFVFDTEMTQLADKIREKNNTTSLLSWPQGFIDAYDSISSLNFDIVGGTTQPSNPKENTIWINTSLNITEWIFSSIEPTSPQQGLVWFMTDTQGIISFDVLSKNSVILYPILAKQYINGEWVGQSAQLYQNNTWKDFWNGILYENGDTNDTNTGGWQFSGYGTFEANAILLGQEPAYTLTEVSVTTKNAVNLATFNSIQVVITYAKSGQVNGYMCIEAINENGNVVARKDVFSGLYGGTPGQQTLDISQCTNKKLKIRIRMTKKDPDWNNLLYARITSVRAIQ